MKKDFIKNYDRAEYTQRQSTLEYLDANNINTNEIREIIIPVDVIISVFPESFIKSKNRDFQYEMTLCSNNWPQITGAISILEGEIKKDFARISNKATRGYKESIKKAKVVIREYYECNTEKEISDNNYDADDYRKYKHEWIEKTISTWEEKNNREFAYFIQFSVRCIDTLKTELEKYKKLKNPHRLREEEYPEDNESDFNALISFIQVSLVKHFIKVEMRSQRETGFIVYDIMCKEYGIKSEFDRSRGAENIRTNIKNILAKSDKFPF